MKGKTGKPSAMRGGGMARKGVGMALKGGGMARKGTGSKATPGGKVAKMAMGGSPPITTMPVRPPAPPSAQLVSSNMINTGSKGPMIPPRGRPTDGPGMVRPGFPSGPMPIKRPGGITTRPDGAMTRPSPIGSKIPSEYQVGMPSPGYSLTGMKKGGKVKGKKNGK